MVMSCTLSKCYGNIARIVKAVFLSPGNGPLPDKLMKGDVQVLSPSLCRSYWGNTVNDNYHICMKDLGDRIYQACNVRFYCIISIQKLNHFIFYNSFSYFLYLDFPISKSRRPLYAAGGSSLLLVTLSHNIITWYYYASLLHNIIT